LKITKQLLADSQQINYEGLLVAPTCNSISASNQPRRTVPENKITTANLSSQWGGCLLSELSLLHPKMYARSRRRGRVLYRHSRTTKMLSELRTHLLHPKMYEEY